jgi:hypothetical protein
VTLFINTLLAPASDGALGFWIRTNLDRSPADLGCEIRGTSAASSLRLLGDPDTAPVAIPRGLLGVWKLQVTLEPAVTGRANVRCTVLHDFVTRTAVTAEVVLPAGTAGFSVENVTAVLHGVTVIERDDEPTL